MKYGLIYTMCWNKKIFYRFMNGIFCFLPYEINPYEIRKRKNRRNILYNYKYSFRFRYAILIFRRNICSRVVWQYLEIHKRELFSFSNRIYSPLASSILPCFVVSKEYQKLYNYFAYIIFYCFVRRIIPNRYGKKKRNIK